MRYNISVLIALIALTVLLHPLPVQTPTSHPASSDRATSGCESERTDGKVNKELTSQRWPNSIDVKMTEVHQTVTVTHDQILACSIQPAMPQALISEGQLIPTGLVWPSTTTNGCGKWCFFHLIDVTDAAVDKPGELQSLQTERNKTSGVWCFLLSVFICVSLPPSFRLEDSSTTSTQPKALSY